MKRSVGGKKAYDSDMDSLDLNPLVKEADLLKQAAEMLEGSIANTAHVHCKIMEQVEEIKEGLQALKIPLDKGKAQIETCKELLATVCHVKETTQHTENYLPAKYLNSATNEAEPEKSSAEKTEYEPPSTGSLIAVTSSCSAPLSKKHAPESTSPYIRCLELEQFENISKYMKGRLTCERVNKFIDAINMVLNKKYQLLSHPRSTLKGKKLDEYDAFKKQETKETKEKGLYFCVEDDLKTLGSITMDKASYKMLNILRCTRRVREIRTAGIIRYAVSN